MSANDQLKGVWRILSASYPEALTQFGVYQLTYMEHIYIHRSCGLVSNAHSSSQMYQPYPKIDRLYS